MRNQKQSFYTIIIGCGRLGATLADALSAQGKDVTIVDKSQSAFRKLSCGFAGMTKLGNGLNLDTLSEIEMAHADEVLVVTDNDNVNVMIAQMAQTIYHVDHVVARLYDPDKKVIMQNVGMDVVCPCELSFAAMQAFIEPGKETSHAA